MADQIKYYIVTMGRNHTPIFDQEEAIKKAQDMLQQTGVGVTTACVFGLEKVLSIKKVVEASDPVVRPAKIGDLRGDDNIEQDRALEFEPPNDARAYQRALAWPIVDDRHEPAGDLLEGDEG